LENLKEFRPLEKSMRRWEANTDTDLIGIRSEDLAVS
jgi:hypothetical protein